MPGAVPEIGRPGRADDRQAITAGEVLNAFHGALVEQGEMHEFDAVHASLTDFPEHLIKDRCRVVPGLLRGEDPKVGTHVDLGFGQGSGRHRG